MAAVTVKLVSEEKNPINNLQRYISRRVQRVGKSSSLFNGNEGI